MREGASQMDQRKRKGIPIGHEDFKRIINEDCYFVDKTLLIEELLESKAQTTLLTRPRRFGKTLNLSMLRRFFEDERTQQGERIDNSGLFNGLAISRCGEDVSRHQGRYPVISLSLKSAKQPNMIWHMDAWSMRLSKNSSTMLMCWKWKCPREAGKVWNVFFWERESRKNTPRCWRFYQNALRNIMART